MTPPLATQVVRTSRPSSSSSNGSISIPLHSSTSIPNEDDYDSDSSNFAPPTPMSLNMAIPVELACAIPLIEKFQVEVFLRIMHRREKRGSQARERFTFEDMICFQRDPIPTSLLKISSDLVSRAVKLFKIILKYMGVDSADKVSSMTLGERIELVEKLYKQTLKRSELRDELFVQISKQTRNNLDKQSLIKAWELMFLCASSMPPSKDIAGYLSEHAHHVAHGSDTASEVQALALNTLNALKRSLKAGPRKIIPDREEIEALLSGRKLTTIVFFLDETFDEITYDMSTTVADAVEEIAGIIKLSAYYGFSLFEFRKVVTDSESSNSGIEEYIGLDDKKYIGDLLAEFKAAKDRSEGDILHCKLIFKKKLFRESDEAITEQMFVQLSYVQLQHDYMLGNYPVERDDAALLSALQILVEFGFLDNPQSCTDWTSLLERFLPRQIAITRAKMDWELDILSRYSLMGLMSKDDARQQFLRFLRNLPYGNSVFFSVRKIDDPIGLLPGVIILGINKRGVHFFRPVPKEYLHSAEFRDIMQFGSSNTAVFFKMRVAGVLHIFQFETKQGEEICVALQTHINDVMLRHYSKARSAASGSVNGDIPLASSSNGISTPLHSSTGILNEYDYDSDLSKKKEDYDSNGFDFPSLTSMSLSLKMAIPAGLASAIPLIKKFQVEGFLRTMHQRIHSAENRGSFSERSVGSQVRARFTFEDMICFQRDPIPTSLLKISSHLVSQAVKVFQIILKYMGVDSSDKVKVSSMTLGERIKLVEKLYKQTLKRSELRDELFVQILKQTRNTPDKQSLIKSWELMFLCASSMPPSKDIAGYLSEHVHHVAHGSDTCSEVQVLALNTLNALKRSLKAGPRQIIPGREEIEALLSGRKLTTKVFFLDETFEEITYDMSTTVADAVKEIAGIIKLSAYYGFSLFECRKVVTDSESSDSGNEEYIGLDDNKYIGDLLAEFKAAKDRSEGDILHCKLTFKKKLFRESDEAITEQMFVQLSYVQLNLNLPHQ